MVLEMKVPHNTSFNALLELFPVFLSYLLSFIYLGIYWGNHHHLLHACSQVNTPIIWANLNLLFWLSLIPFATAWMGENHFENNTVVLYCMLMVCCAIAYYVLQQFIARHHKENEKLNAAMKKQSKKGIISLIVYLVATPVACYWPYFSSFLLVAVAIMWIVPDRNIEKALHD